MSRGRLIAALLAALALLVVEEVWRRDPERQVRASLARIEAAFQDRDASGIFSEVHQDYPVTVLWPSLFGDHDPATARDQARRLLAVLFLQSRDQVLSCRITVRRLDVTDVVVVARGDLAVDGGIFGQAVPLLSDHRFTFRRTSWLTGRYALDGHEPIALRQ